MLALAAPAIAVAGEAFDAMRERILRMTEFFDTTLPGTVGRRNLTLSFTPKFSDFRDHEYVRSPFEIRYGLAERWELTGGVTPFAPNPVNSGADHRWGLGEARTGVRYDLGKWINFFDDTTVGLELRVPVGQPPTALNDHFTHLKPTVSAAHTLNRWPDTTFYANLSYDRSVRLFPRGEPPAGVVRRNVTEAVPGLLFKPGEFGTFAEYRLRQVREPTEWYFAHEARAGGIWDVPLARSAQWRLPGKWQLELAYKYRVSGQRDDETDQGVVARVTWRTTLREFLTGTNSRMAPANP